MMVPQAAVLPQVISPSPKDQPVDSWILPERVLTSDQVTKIRTDAYNLIVDAATKNGIGIVNSRSGLAVRHLEAFNATVGVDANVAGATAGTPDWLTGAYTTGTALAFVNQTVNTSVFQCIYGVAVRPILPQIEPCTMVIRFMRGAGGSVLFRGVMSSVYTTGASNDGSYVGYLTQPVIFRPNDPAYVELTPVITAAGGERVELLGFVAEIIGNRVSRQEDL